MCSNRRMLEVVAGILERDGRVLICRRKAGQAHAFKWEFPGGKVEAGESLAGALARELGEELGVAAVESEEIARYEFAYPGKPSIRLIFFRVTKFEGDPRNLVFEEMRWAPRESLSQFAFLEGVVEFLGGMGAGRY